MTEVLDISRDEDGKITQFLILTEDGQPDTKVGTPENLLLYDPEEKLKFEGGLHSFLHGEGAIRLSDDPDIIVSGDDEYRYTVIVDGSVVETLPGQSSDVLRAIYDAAANDDSEKILDIHDKILDTQVRRDLMGMLKDEISDSHRIDIIGNGWLIDGFYLVNWEAKMYTLNDISSDENYVRDKGEVVKKDKSYEFVRIDDDIRGSDKIEVTVDGETKTLCETEVLFLSKVKWLLNRRYYHPDKPFWDYSDRWADTEDENLGVFEF